jgi:SAM-dependent methyltransferase
MSYKEVQQKAFGEMIDQGVYSADFSHSIEAKLFFEDSVRYISTLIDTSKEISVLDCGCGTGFWLDVFCQAMGSMGPTEVQCYGFDLTPGMIDIARKKLARSAPPSHLHQGDILEDESYTFDAAGQTFDLIYAYDVIQQLPRSLQWSACQAMLCRLAPRGIIAIFDHDRFSTYGLKMGFKKFLTKYLQMRLVPSFYCNARYPSVAKLRRLVKAAEGHVQCAGWQNGGQTPRWLYSTEVRTAPDGQQHLLIIRSVEPQNLSSPAYPNVGYCTDKVSSKPRLHVALAAVG